MNRKLLVIGCGRSGTRYISKLLIKCGVDVGHERTGKDGVASWYMTPGLESEAHYTGTGLPFGKMSKYADLGSDPIIIHQVRHPLKAIASQQTFLPASWKYVESFAFTKISPKDSRLLKCMKYWYYWNLKAEQSADALFRVEELPNEFEAFCVALGRPELVSDASYKILKETSTTINSRRKRYTPLAWRHLHKEAPHLCTRIKKLATKYNYDIR